MKMKQLEKIYLMNVALYIESIETIKRFEMISKNCQESVHMLRINPFGINFVYLQKEKSLFPRIQTIYELKSLQEIDLFVLFWLDEITFIRRINASLLFYFLGSRTFENKEEITKKLLEKIEHISMVITPIDSLSSFIHSIPLFKNVKSMKIKYIDEINWSLFNELPQLRRIEVLFLFHCPDNLHEKFRNVNFVKINYQFLFEINSGDEMILERIMEVKQRMIYVGININVLTQSMEQYYCNMLGEYVQPSYFVENEDITVLHQCYPVELKILSRKEEFVDSIDLNEFICLKKLIVIFKNTKEYYLNLPSTLTYLSVDSSQALFSVNHLPLETFFFVSGINNTFYFNSTLKSISLYNCSNTQINISGCINFHHLTASACRHLTITLDERIATFSLCHCFATTFLINHEDKTRSIISIEKLSDFMFKPTSKIIGNIECEVLDLSKCKIKQLSLYETTISLVKLPELMNTVRIVNSAISDLYFEMISKLIVQDNSVINIIHGNTIRSLNFDGIINQWNINLLHQISYHRGYISPEIECIIMKIKSKEEYVNLAQIQIEQLILSSKAKIKVLFLNNSIQTISSNKSNVHLFKKGKQQLNKQEINTLLKQTHCSFPPNTERAIVKISNKHIQSLDLSNCFIKKLLLHNCPQLKSLVIPSTLSHLHLQYCPNLSFISFSGNQKIIN